jgi:hypothetical protein
LNLSRVDNGQAGDLEEVCVARGNGKSVGDGGNAGPSRAACGRGHLCHAEQYGDPGCRDHVDQHDLFPRTPPANLNRFTILLKEEKPATAIQRREVVIRDDASVVTDGLAFGLRSAS